MLKRLLPYWRPAAGQTAAGAGLLLVTVGWALHRSRARLASLVEDWPVWQPPFPGVAHAPVASGTRVECPWPGWLVAAAVLLAFAVFAVTFYLAETGVL